MVAQAAISNITTKHLLTSGPDTYTVAQRLTRAVAQLSAESDKLDRLSTNIDKIASHLDELVNSTKFTVMAASGLIKKSIPALIQTLQQAIEVMVDINTNGCSNTQLEFMVHVRQISDWFNQEVEFFTRAMVNPQATLILTKVTPLIASILRDLLDSSKNSSTITTMNQLIDSITQCNSIEPLQSTSEYIHLV